MFDPAEEEVTHQPLWSRWDGTRGLFYQAAQLRPFEKGLKEAAVTGDTRPSIEFVSGLPRLALRNVPLLLPIAAAIYFTAQHFGPYKTPFGKYISLSAALPGESIGLTYVPLGVLGLVWVGLILHQFVAVGIVNVRNIHRDLAFLLTAGILAGFAVFSVYLVTNADDPGKLQPHVMFDGGYWLFILVAAHLVYDGLVLRSENLFSRLGETEIVDRARYEAFREDLERALQDEYSIEFAGRTVGIARSQLFALLILGPVAPIPVVAIDSTLVGDIGYVTQVVSGYFTLVILFQFIVLIRYFNRLLSDQYEVEIDAEAAEWNDHEPDGVVSRENSSNERSGYATDGGARVRADDTENSDQEARQREDGDGSETVTKRVSLEYKPFHPDDRGGFRALGNFAMRVNLIFVVVGAYLAYRFYTQGFTALPPGGFESTLGLVNWVVNFPGPIALYAFVVIMWLYKSFWRMHVKMEQGRRRMVKQLQEGPDRPEEVPAGQFEALTPDGQAWQGMQNAPVWPVNRSSLLAILLLDAMPIIYAALM